MGPRTCRMWSSRMRVLCWWLAVRSKNRWRQRRTGEPKARKENAIPDETRDVVWKSAHRSDEAGRAPLDGKRKHAEQSASDCHSAARKKKRSAKHADFQVAPVGAEIHEDPLQDGGDSDFQAVRKTAKEKKQERKWKEEQKVQRQREEEEEERSRKKEDERLRKEKEGQRRQEEERELLKKASIKDVRAAVEGELDPNESRSARKRRKKEEKLKAKLALAATAGVQSDRASAAAASVSPEVIDLTGGEEEKKAKSKKKDRRDMDHNSQRKGLQDTGHEPSEGGRAGPEQATVQGADETLGGTLDRLSTSQLELSPKPAASTISTSTIHSKHIFVGDARCRGSVFFSADAIKLKLKLPDEQLQVTLPLKVPQDVVRIELPSQALPTGQALLRIELGAACLRFKPLQRFLQHAQPRAIDVYAKSKEDCRLNVKSYLASASPEAAQAIHQCTEHNARLATFHARLGPAESGALAEESAPESKLVGGPGVQPPGAQRQVAVGETQRRTGIGAILGGADSTDLFTYPLRGTGRDTVTVSVGDVRTLCEGEFLNDTVVDFYLKLLQARMTAQQRAQCHFFTSFLWKKLQLETDQRNPDPHSAVARWTRHVDIFDKAFLFVPICVSLHWRLAIICWPHPKSAGPAPPDASGGAGLGSCILYLDSMGGSLSRVSAILSSYLRREWETKKMTPSSHSSPPLSAPASALAPAQLQVRAVPVPRQTNGSDCGLFVLAYLTRFVADFVAPESNAAAKVSAAGSDDAERERAAQQAAVRSWMSGGGSREWFRAPHISEFRQRLFRDIAALAAEASASAAGLV